MCARMGIASADEMHEYSIVTALLDRVEQEARAHGAVAVHVVTGRLGELAGVECDLLASAFDLVRTNTICSEAIFRVEPVPAEWVCRTCGAAIARGAALRCALCGEPARLAAGGEIVLQRLEMEVP